MSGHANGHNGVGPGKFVYPDSPLHELFHQQVARTPDRIAVIDQERELTYTELKRQTQTLALSLRHRGVSEEQPVVPIFMPRCLEFAVGYIAALSAGGAYLPLEVGYPAEMLRRVLAEAKPVLTLTLESQAAKLPADAPRLCLDPGWEEACALLPAELAALPSLATSLESLAYCVYSSGTTGEPKGISCPHRGSVLSYSHRAHHAPYAADGSDREACNVFFVWEMLRPLLQGATLVVVPDSVIYDPPALSSFLERHAVTRMLFTPSLLEAVLDSPALASGDELRRAFAAFRVVVLCGEVATAELRARVLSLAPAGLKLLNLYSISECHDVSMVDLAATPPPEGKYCSTGPLLDGVEVLILEDANQAEKSGEAQRGADAAKALRPVPLGLPGEVFVSGPCLARGYLQRPDLTAKKFLPRPPSLSATPAPQTPGQDAASPALYSRLYDTGDWGRLRPDGTLEILGRHDSMQKIRGYSVELRAVEAALLQCQGVTSCVVRVVGEEGTDKHLAAFVVFERERDGGSAGEAAPRQARAELHAAVPHYMVPSFIVPMDELPTNEVSGKLDHKALPRTLPELLRFVESSGGARGPQLRTPTEAAVGKVWAEVLELPAAMVDPEESFFDQGGHSLRATRLIAALNQGGYPAVRVASLFEHPTIRELSAHLDADGASRADKAPHTPLPRSVVEKEIAALAGGMPVGFDSALRAYWHGVSLASRRVDSCSSQSASRVGSYSSLLALGAEGGREEGCKAREEPLQLGCAGECVLLTGATGFLGAFVLRELLAAGERGPKTIFCLVRASATETALERVMGTLERFGLWESEGGWAARIEGIEGDTALKSLGLSNDHYQYLATVVDRVIHAAARVNLVFPYAGLRRDNVVSTTRVLHFAMDHKVKPVTYVSTDAVFRPGTRGPHAEGEADLDAELPLLTTGYAQSKCVAELLVREAAKRGLPTTIVRPGNLGGCDPRAAIRPRGTRQLIHAENVSIGRTPRFDAAEQVKAALDAAERSRGGPSSLSDKVAAAGWNSSDSNFLMLVGCALLGAAPGGVGGWSCELTPVDFAARAVVALSGDSGAVGQAYNLVNSDATLPWDAVLDAARSCGVAVESLPYATFRERLEAAAGGASEAAQAILRPLWDLLSPLATPEALAANDATASFESAALRAVCSRRGAGAYPPLDIALVREYCWHLLDAGVFPRPAVGGAAGGAEPRRLTGQVAVVTGASGGIGAAIARQLAAAGAAVCLAARRKGRIESLAGELSRAHGVPTLAVVADVTDRASVKACVREAEGALGPVSVLVSNAGVMHYTLMKNLHEDEWAQAVDVNCKGMLNAVGAVLPGMLSRGRGHILTITSDAGRKAFPGLSVYSGTKFFNEAVSQGLRAECVGTGVKVTTVQPGDCRSELPACTTDEEARGIYAQPSKDRNVWLDPLDVADTVVWALSQPPHVAVNEVLVEPRDAPA